MLSDDLLELQRIDSVSDQLAHRRANLAERAASEKASAELAATKRRIAELLARQRELGDAIEQAEETGAELTRTRERLQAQLRTVTSPREAEALMHELDTLASRRDELDDAELANLEEQSQVVDDLAEAHRADVELAAAAERATAELAAAEAAIDEQLAELTDTTIRSGDSPRRRTAVGLRAPSGTSRRRRRRPARRPPLRRLPSRPLDRSNSTLSRRRRRGSTPTARNAGGCSFPSGSRRRSCSCGSSGRR